MRYMASEYGSLGVVKVRFAKDREPELGRHDLSTHLDLN